MGEPEKFEAIRIRLARRAVEALAGSEEGRHEDYLRERAERAAEADPSGEAPEPCLAYSVAMVALEAPTSQRYVTMVVDSPDVACDLYYAVCSGTFQLDHVRTARRIADALRDSVRRVDPGLVSRWRSPEGG